jgi:hypothetical protein
MKNCLVQPGKLRIDPFVHLAQKQQSTTFAGFPVLSAAVPIFLAGYPAVR